MNKFKVGEKVYMNKVGYWAIIQKIVKNKYHIIDENGNAGWDVESNMEKFIEPKYKVRDMFYKYPSCHKDEGMGDVCEVVKISLNKKAKEYSYLCFDKFGYCKAFNESEVVPVEKKSKVITVSIKEIESKMNEIFRSMGKDYKIKINK